MSNSYSPSLFGSSTGAILHGLTNDYMFHAVFQNNPIARKRFLAALLDIPYDSITSCEVKNPIILGEYFDAKDIILDLLLEINHEQIINLEMQMWHLDFWDKRALFYLSKTYSNLERGEDYRQLKPAMQIGILPKSPFPDKHTFYSEYYMMNPKNHHIFSRNFCIRMLNLGQIDHVLQEEQDTSLYYWARLLTAKTWEEVRTLTEQKEYLSEAALELHHLNDDEKIRLQCEARERYERDISSIRAAGFSEGHESGFSEGHESGFSEGHESGFSEGHESGFSEGHESGFSEGHESGFSEGHESGFSEGQRETANRLNLLISLLMKDGRSPDLLRSCTDPAFQEQLMKEYHL